MNPRHHLIASVPDEIWREAGVEGQRIYLFLVLAAGSDGTITIGRNLLGEITHMRKPNVTRALNRLRDLGLIDVECSKGGRGHRSKITIKGITRRYRLDGLKGIRGGSKGYHLKIPRLNRTDANAHGDRVASSKKGMLRPGELRRL